jgi:hypothetical protein
MIHLVDHILRLGLLANVPGLTDQQVGFQPPDQDWRTRVGTVAGVSLNVYLAELQEDRGLRTNARHIDYEDGVAFSTAAPERIRLHYVITAWSHAKDTVAVHSTEAEHAMLGAVLAVLFRTAPVSATRLLSYADIMALPEELRGDLPTRIAPPDGFPRMGDFWGTMGRPQAWKPAINLMVTAPVVYAPDHIGGIVDTILADFGVGEDPIAPPAVQERLLVVGGVVLDARPPHNLVPVPVPGARVDLLEVGGQPRARVTTDPSGQFAFDALPPGTYQLAYSKVGIPAHLPVPFTVPLAAGPIRLEFV